ncbi:ABC transporter substrate-binding protein [Sediminivirga luteola]|uniref:ABC transporter substrate-binding protein n=2 Tax=Sediminivirga luteola TaxID=1774748 RepID=A0A8J2TV52_9MICO|nr:ABC transporter substrate-binding protein [Sediminivirga luteola]GGA02549.1 ABC transporter substrate-binding protein [Sediminivirga luteola]
MPRTTKLTTILGASAAATLLATGCGSGAGGDASAQLYVADGGGAWGEAQRQAFFEPFTEETGIEIVPASQESQTAIYAAAEAGNPGMDVVNIAASMLPNWENAELLQPVSSDGWETVDTADFDPFPVLDHAVPSLIYATQIAYRPDTTGGDLEDWSDFFDTAAYPGQRSMGEGSVLANGVFEIALLADGVAPDDLYPIDYERALAKMDDLRPDILTFWSSGAESAQLLADQQVAAVSAWNGRVNDLAADDDSIAYTWNQALLHVDYWAVPEGADNVEAAQQFIEFASRPDRQAEFAGLITYAPTNAAAYDDIDEDRQAALPTAPGHADQVVPQSTEYWGEESPEGGLWSEVAIGYWQDWISG